MKKLRTFAERQPRYPLLQARRRHSSLLAGLSRTRPTPKSPSREEGGQLSGRPHLSASCPTSGRRREEFVWPGGLLPSSARRKAVGDGIGRAREQGRDPASDARLRQGRVASRAWATGKEGLGYRDRHLRFPGRSARWRPAQLPLPGLPNSVISARSTAPTRPRSASLRWTRPKPAPVAPCRAHVASPGNPGPYTPSQAGHKQPADRAAPAPRSSRPACCAAAPRRRSPVPLPIFCPAVLWRLGGDQRPVSGSGRASSAPNRRRRGGPGSF